ncbi:kinase-like protein [Thelephora ganbajun]|uniref:Kinase-like protein n=1 Tax=Thelephora ganbajun TaxID=370292 RepID=A0ACB6Z5Q6_THEGA|nr:kinase-like protein [Thelephora ganbajun]
MTASEVLQHLYLLNTSSPDFLRVLYGLIRYDEDEQYSSTLEGAELTRLVDFLDDVRSFPPVSPPAANQSPQALCSIHTSDDVFRRCLRKLRAICGCHSILPSSHIIRGDLKRIGDGAIAFGGFADVWQGSHDGKRVCIKVLRISLNDDEFLTKSFYKEAVVWKRLRHPNVVPFLGVAHKPLQFVSEWMPNGTITRYVRDNPGADRINLLLDVAEGLNYLHTSYTIHGDLKGPNIIVNHDGHACLTDFGLASISHGINSIRVTHAHGHTPRWTAPEILKGAEEITREADIFSFGMVVIEVFTGRHPFNDSIATSVTFKIMDGERPARPQGTQELGLVDPVWGMTVNCWQQEPTHRPIMAAVVGFLREW